MLPMTQATSSVSKTKICGCTSQETRKSDGTAANLVDSTELSGNRLTTEDRNSKRSDA